MEKPQIIVVTENNLNYIPFDVKWMPRSAKILTLGSYHKGTGALELYELEDGKLKLIQSTEFPKPLKCGTFAASCLEERHFAMGGFDGKLNVVDLSRPEDPVYSANAHSGIINCIDGIAGLNIGKGAPELVTGSNDGTVKVWDPRQKDKPVITVEPEEDSDRRDCWCVAFGNAHSAEDRVICAGFDNGDLKFFDLRTMKIMWETQLGNGVCSVQFDRKDIEMNKLVASTLESTFSVFDLRTFHSEKGYASLTGKAHGPSTVWCVKHLPQNREVFITSGGNGSLNLWKYSYPSKRTKELDDGSTVGVMGDVALLQDTTVTAQPIMSFDWSPDKCGLCSCIGVDQTLRLLIITKLNTV